MGADDIINLKNCTSSLLCNAPGGFLYKFILNIDSNIQMLDRGLLVQMDRTWTFKIGAFMWNIRKKISKGEYDYALVPEHPFATKLGYVFMHRIIMENYLGRLLDKNEIVHHKNENKKDNRIENLQVMTNEEHARYHQLKRGIIMVDLICPYCKKEFSKPKNKTFLDKKNVYNFTCCSPRCRGKFSREIQLHGLTYKVQNAISANIVRIYRKRILDNAEVTEDIQEP